ncbi:MAG: STAS domain-containing protein [Candidatus Ancaeobacter aquaticus]|nr:STAS domain-containing protein [Candidatus Ancaeobacter aquaticus]
MITLNVREENGWNIVTVDGQIDLYSSPDIRKELLSQAKTKKVKIVVDLSKVSYIDSSGVATLIEAMQKLKKVDGEIALVGLSESVKHVFEIARLESVFAIYKDIADLFSKRS